MPGGRCAGGAIYVYSPNGRVATVTKLNGVTLAAPLVTTYAYDAAGNKKTETLPDGEQTTYTYDALNRLTDVRTKQGATTLFSQHYVLSDDGTRKSVDETQRQPDDSTVTSHTDWTYDADGRLTGEIYTSSVTGRGYEDLFAYDLNGNRVRQQHTPTVIASYAVTVSPGNDPPPFWTATTFTLEPQSPTEWSGAGNSPYSSMATMTRDSSGNWELDLESADAEYNTASGRWTSPDLDSGQWTLDSWDPTGWTWTDPKGGEVEYDPATGTWHTTDGTYSGTWTGPVLTSFMPTYAAGPTETTAYTYNERDQLTTEDSADDAHDVTYRYDPNGSQTEQVKGAETTRYLWDLRGRMVAVDGNGDNDLSIDAKGITSGTVNDASDATYAYDTDGVRIAEGTPGGSTTYYLNDADNPTGYTKAVEEKTGTSLATATVSRSYVVGLKVEGQEPRTGAGRLAAWPRVRSPGPTAMRGPDTLKDFGSSIDANGAGRKGGPGS